MFLQATDLRAHNCIGKTSRVILGYICGPINLRKCIRYLERAAEIELLLNVSFSILHFFPALNEGGGREECPHFNSSLSTSPL